MRDVTPAPTPDNELEVVEVTQELVHRVCEAVSNGWTTSRWCVANKISHGAFMAAIRTNSYFDKLVKLAKKDREEWLREKIITIIDEMMMFDPRDAYDANGNILPMNEMPKHVAAMIKEQKIKMEPAGRGREPDEVMVLKFYDKQKAIDQLGKHLQMFIDQSDLNIRLTLEETIANSRRKSQTED